MSMPDPTLGRVQNKEFNNQIEALQNIKNDVSNGITQQMQIIAQWRNREEDKAEKERQRGWEAEQRKLDRDHATSENTTAREWQRDENKTHRSWQGEQAQADRDHRKAINDTNIVSNEKIANNKNWNDRVIANTNANQVQALTANYQTQEDGKPQYLSTGQLAPKEIINMNDAQPQQQNAQQANTQDLPLQRN